VFGFVDSNFFEFYAPEIFTFELLWYSTRSNIENMCKQENKRNKSSILTFEGYYWSWWDVWGLNIVAAGLVWGVGVPVLGRS
jgi:hypothetical protein